MHDTYCDSEKKGPITLLFAMALRVPEGLEKLMLQYAQLKEKDRPLEEQKQKRLHDFHMRRLEIYENENKSKHKRFVWSMSFFMGFFFVFLLVILKWGHKDVFFYFMDKSWPLLMIAGAYLFGRFSPSTSQPKTEKVESPKE